MAQVVWAIQNEFAETVEDILARRIRLLFLDAKAAIESTEKVAHCMMLHKNRNEVWKTNQIEKFTKLANEYLTY